LPLAEAAARVAASCPLQRLQHASCAEAGDADAARSTLRSCVVRAAGEVLWRRPERLIGMAKKIDPAKCMKIGLGKNYRYRPAQIPIHRWPVSSDFIRCITKAPKL
jgi:hypothetical protein